MTTPLRAALAVSLLAMIGGGTFYAKNELFGRGTRLLPGLKVAGELVPDDVARGDDAAIAAWIVDRERPLLDRDLEIRADHETRTVSLRTLVAPPDVSPVVARLRSFGHESALSARIDSALRARKGEIDLPLEVTPDVSAIEHVVADLKSKIDAPPTDAKLDLAAHTTFPDTQGHFLDFDGGSVAISEFVAHHWHEASPADGSKPAVQLAALTVDARVTAASLGKLDISTVLASFETHFGRGGDQAPRATNIENASKKLDGLVLEPQQLVSFNAVVGERSEANGFKVAWEIFKGEMRPGVGGGTCQVASTLHAAAFFGGLDILERLPHSRPSAYIPMGLDSTVVYPSTDLKLKNPYPFAVVVHTLVTGNTLKVELLGKEKPVSVTFARDTAAVLPYERRIDEESYVTVGKAIKKQGGIRGYRIKRVRVLTALTAIGGTIGESRTEESFDFYPPTVEIYVVAPGTDPNELPAMPEDVVAALLKKKGEPPPEYAVTDAIACAGDCEGETKPKLEVLTGAGVHAATGDQVAPMPKVLIKQ